MLSNVFALIALFLSPALAQLPGLPLPVPAASTASPYGFSIKQINSLDTAPIIFEGQRLFEIAAPAAAPNVSIPPIVERVDTINDNLRRIVPVGPGLGLSSAPSRF
ncbi:MAG: hypothetical protein JOY69_09055, partial [Candidatus Eremiobacteraeota bacterium]|nr:hypothetical protein [Candidatus Eremiobacteraeota bacterium]